MQPAKQIKDELYVSYSQLFTYSTCSLKYKFQYVEQRQPERISANLPFGNAIHAALEFYYTDVLKTGLQPQVEHMLEVFCASILQQTEESETPIVFKKELPDVESMLTMGEAMILSFCDDVNLDGFEIVGVEVPLSATLFDEDREPLDIKLFGVIDLLLKDSSGNLLCADNKTSKHKKSQAAVDEDLQLTAYSYLLAANGFTFPRAKIQCRFDVLRKLKSPSFELYHTSRSAEDRKRFAKLTKSILQGIENRIFYPTSSWLCADCQFCGACKTW